MTVYNQSKLHPDIPPEWIDQVVTGDAADLGRRLPDQSIDLCFCDPPYLQEYLPTYSTLSALAARVLKPDAWCFAYTGQYHLPEVLSRMGEHLVYRWTIAILHGLASNVWAARVTAAYKPIVVYGLRRAQPTDRLIRDVVPPSRRDKRYHTWGQSETEAIKYIGDLTNPGDLVLDPFCGGGTTLAACKYLDRRYIGFELNPVQADVARRRLSEQPVLFTTPYTYPKQGVLISQE